MVALLLFRMMSSVLHCSKIFLIGLNTVVFMRHYCAIGCIFFQVNGTHCSIILERQDCRSF